MRCLCASSGLYTSSSPGDCNDGNTNINPGETESCNALDDDCDGLTDEENATGCTVYYEDKDEDEFGISSSAHCICGRGLQ